MKKILALILLLLVAYVSSLDSAMIIGLPSSERVYLFDYTFDGSDEPSWDANTCTEDCTPDAQTEYCDDCDAACDANAPIKGTQSLFVEGETCYLREGLGGSYTELYVDFWLNFSAGWSGAVHLQDSSNSSRVWFYINGGPDLDLLTSVDGCNGPNVLSAGTDYHIRFYYKEDTTGSDGVLKLWYSTTDEDFDGDTADYTCDTLDTHNNDITQVAFYGIGGGVEMIYDNVQVWEPDGNE